MSQQPKTTYFLSTPVLNAVLNYLGTRPHGEVEQLVTQLRKELAPQVPAATAPITATPEAATNETEKVA